MSDYQRGLATQGREPSAIRWKTDSSVSDVSSDSVIVAVPRSLPRDVGIARANAVNREGRCGSEEVNSQAPAWQRS